MPLLTRTLMAACCCLAACGDDDDGPYGFAENGEIGAYCTQDAECNQGICCVEDDCAFGMCTFPCDDDDQCPPEMACDHSGDGQCLFICGGGGACPIDFECNEDFVCEGREAGD